MKTSKRIKNKKEKKPRGRPLDNLSDRDKYPEGSFGRLQPLDYEKREEDANGSRIYWRCRCSCGNPNDVWVRSNHLKAKKSPIRSCGCFRSDVSKVLMFDLHTRLKTAN